MSRGRTHRARSPLRAHKQNSPQRTGPVPTASASGSLTAFVTTGAGMMVGSVALVGVHWQERTA
jgi:hypothetical protein